METKTEIEQEMLAEAYRMATALGHVRDWRIALTIEPMMESLEYAMGCARVGDLETAMRVVNAGATAFYAQTFRTVTPLTMEDPDREALIVVGRSIAAAESLLRDAMLAEV